VRDIAAGPDGNVWFTEEVSEGEFLVVYDLPQIGRITPTGEITEFSLASFSSPQSIAPGSDGNLWFTGGNEIGRITSTGTVTLFSFSTTAVVSRTPSPLDRTAPRGSQNSTGMRSDGSPQMAQLPSFRSSASATVTKTDTRPWTSCSR